MIEPTIGRVVWYKPDPENGIDNLNAVGDQMHAATVAYVHGNEMVNLAVVDANGVSYAKTSVPLWQGDAEECPAGSCCWMPYQKKQAAKDAA